ncbi:hypothetical protein EDC55_10283 [Allofrancisella inopinata]|uniref:Uncharacterized protein n=1 Tax=Allofrancisella inopinata TaxID=1085647 RepID=A0AAE6YHN2_9GAMM|nr:hypothetical protein [Allofrancisella inopinata]QIV95975.1 hypothetical protein E4K63_03675 [Allofrancisella inopinata]TDT74397.1 hypothetical protein EDC55_10283 [Allofrancisella inopinata]
MYYLNFKKKQLQKLLLATTLTLPTLGYCGFIDWISNYTEVTNEIQQRLEQKYYGDKFEVWDVSYSSNLDEYNFKYKLEDSNDATYIGSYSPKGDRLVANEYMWEKISKEWRAIFVPYVKIASNNYFLIGGIATQYHKNSKKYKIDYRSKALDDLFSESLTAQEWINKDHNVIAGSISIFIEIPRTAEGIYKTLQMAEKIHAKLRSFGLSSYKLEIITYDLPNKFDIDKYFNQVKDNFVTSIDWWFEPGIQKYAWGYLYLDSCQKVDTLEESCDGYKENDTNNDNLTLIKDHTPENRIRSLSYLAKKFRLVDWFGTPNKCDPIFGCSSIWLAKLRANKSLKSSQHYPTLVKLINKEG